MGINMVAVVWSIPTTFWVLATMFVVARIYSKKVLADFYGICDTVAICAMVLATGDYVLKVLWILNGLGRHVQDVDQAKLLMFSRVVYARTVTYPWALALAKISILIFYRRIFPIDKFRKICEWFIAVMILMTLATSMASAFACHPLGNGPKLIHRVKGDGCIDRFALQFVANALHLVTDVMIWLLPMKHLWHLRVKKQKRIRTIVIFSLGLIPCIASAIRLQTIHRLYKGVDPTYDAVGIAIWSSIEVNLVIIAASIPASSTFYNTFFVQPVRKRFVNALPMKPLPDSDSYPFNNSNYMWTIEGAKTTIPTSQGENTKSTPATKGIHMTIETTRKDSCHSIYNPDPDGLDEEERYGQHVAQG